MTMDMMQLADFLVEAKRRTYAGLDDDATVTAPLLRGSKKLEHQALPFAYLDIYFGMGFFVGQETVSMEDRVVWSMCYSGGTLPDITDKSKLLSIYSFLRRALSAIDTTLPFRGPPCFSSGDLTYENGTNETLARFHGAERILRHGREVFELRYSGGFLR